MSQVFWGFSEKQPRSTFAVEEMPTPILPGEQVMSNINNLRFEDDVSLGSQLFGFAIIHNILKLGNDILLVINPSDRGDYD